MVDRAHDGASLTPPGGDRARLLLEVYDELRRIAESQLSQEGEGHSLQATALVHEAYLRLADYPRLAELRDESQMIALAVEVMRHILIDRARSRQSEKRGGGRKRVPLTDQLDYTVNDDDQVLAVDEALEKLRRQDPDLAQIVRLKYFGGLTTAQIGKVVKMSRATVYRQLRFGRAWLIREVEGTA